MSNENHDEKGRFSSSNLRAQIKDAMSQKQAPYLHNPRNLHLIADAAKMADMGAAVRSIMDFRDIKTDAAAKIFLSDTNWPKASTREREQKLSDWLRFELKNQP